MTTTTALKRPATCERCGEPTPETGPFRPYRPFAAEDEPWFGPYWEQRPELPGPDDRVVWMCAECAYRDVEAPRPDSCEPRWHDPDGDAWMSADLYWDWIGARIEWATIPHGTRSGYDRHKCRCENCRAANAEHARVARARKAAETRARLVVSDKTEGGNNDSNA